MALLSCRLPGFVVRVTPTLGLTFPVRQNRAAARSTMVATGPVGRSVLGLRSAGSRARFTGEWSKVVCV